MTQRKARLFLGNLPRHSSEEHICQHLQKYGTVNSVEIKQKKDLDNETITSTFAFVNLETDDSTLQQCLRELRSRDWDGSYIKAELAKESFLDRLQREREEALKPSLAQDAKEHHDSPTNSNIYSISLSENSCRKRKTLINDEPKELCKEEKLVSKLESFSDLWKDDLPARLSRPLRKERIVRSSDSFREYNNAHHVSKEEYTSRNDGSNSADKFDSITAQLPSDADSKSALLPGSGKDSGAKAAELKRVRALEEKCKAFKQQKDAIKQALLSINQTKPLNKIIFDDDGGPVSAPQIPSKVDLIMRGKKDDKNEWNRFSKEKERPTSCANGQLQLFGGDDDNDDWQGDFRFKKQFEGKKGKQLLELQARFKDDERFVIDERFYESDEEKGQGDGPSLPATEEEKQLQEEKAKEMEILASVLGEPVQPTVSKKNAFSPMVRFDPLKPSHAKFELPKPNDRKLKSMDIGQKNKPAKSGEKEQRNQRVEEEPLPVDEKQFYQVATNLKDLFKKDEKAVQSTETTTFSLRQMFSSNKYDEPREEIEVSKSKFAEISQSKPKPSSKPVLRGFQNSEPLAMFTKKVLRPELNGITNTFCKDVDVEAIKEKFSQKRRVLGRMLHKKKVTLERQQHFKQKIGVASLARRSLDRQSAICSKSSKSWEKKGGRR